MNDFRYDINFLRSLAIVGVLLFHFEPALLPGGFAGVDVFFVISGFLMTKIIIKSIDDNKFNLVDFYFRRFIRIVPALLFLCLTLLILGYFYLNNLDYLRLSKNVFGSVLFLSNIFYWKDSGYFSPNSNENFLLHTWSLSAEWQFYLIYPLFILVIYRLFSKNSVSKFLVFATLFSFLFSVVASYLWPNPAYFLLPTRAWEMLIGGVAYFYPLKSKNKNIVGFFGVFLILSSYFLLSKNSVWPGYLSLIPVFGAYFFITSSLNEFRMFKNKTIQYIGLQSYSIYLWHWPVVVCGVIFELDNWVIFGVTLTFLFSYFSFRFVESFNWSAYLKYNKFNKFKLVASYSLLLIFSCFSYFQGGFESRFKPEVIIASNERLNTNPLVNHCLFDDTGCYFKNGSLINGNQVKSVDYILVGDSHSFSLLSSFLKSLNHDETTLYFGSAACFFIPGLDAPNSKFKSCDIRIDKFYNEIINLYPEAKLIYVHRNNIYFKGYQTNEHEQQFQAIRTVSGNQDLNLIDYSVDFLCQLSRSRDIFLLKSIPEQTFNVPLKLSRDLFYDKELPSLPLSSYIDRNKYLSGFYHSIERCGVTVLDPTEYLCTDSYCVSNYSGRPIYSDDDHLSEFGSRFLTPMFATVFNK
ncbi:TPA: acyltransferase [Vibrio vulnificus]|nr:acyltransferase [Vibrio vulnificus]